MRTRIPAIDPERLSGPEAELYASYATGQRAEPGVDFSLVAPDGQLTGPPATWMLNADLGVKLERLGYGLRFDLSLPARSREIVILMVAAAEDSPFERYAHHRAARRAGLGDDEIALLDEGGFVAADAREAVLVRVAESILGTGALPDELWGTAVEHLGDRAIFEIVTLIGWYRLMALHLRVFEVDPPA